MTLITLSGFWWKFFKEKITKITKIKQGDEIFFFSFISARIMAFTIRQFQAWLLLLKFWLLLFRKGQYTLYLLFLIVFSSSSFYIYIYLWRWGERRISHRHGLGFTYTAQKVVYISKKQFLALSAPWFWLLLIGRFGFYYSNFGLVIVNLALYHDFSRDLLNFSL